MSWLVRERDLRGYVPGKGWAHAMAHGADAIGVLAQSPHGRPRADRAPRRDRRPAAEARRPAARAGEPDRMAAATMRSCAATSCRIDVLEPWVARIVAAANPFARHRRRDPLRRRRQRAGLPARAHLQLALAPTRPTGPRPTCCCPVGVKRASVLAEPCSPSCRMGHRGMHCCVE